MSADDDNATTFADKIRQWYDALPPKRRDAECRLCGLNPASVRYWRRGKRLPKKDTIERVRRIITQVVIEVAAKQIETLLPLLEYAFSDACSVEDRRALRERSNGNFSRVGDLMNALSSNKSRENFLAANRRQGTGGNGK